jgi:hypothetical protein
MSLDATVYCDCYEKGRVRRPPPQPELVYVDENGQVTLKWDAPGADQFAFYGWLKEACEHGPMGEMVSHRIGNIARVGFLRSTLSENPKEYPLLLARVVYNGIHSGDTLSSADVESLRPELERLREVHGKDAVEEEMIREFELQMQELTDAVLRLNKPIVF